MINIQDVMRAGYVKRWNIVNTFRPQTLAEHLFNVAMIAHCICERSSQSPYITAMCVQYSLVHDIPEVVCGDTPTPTKKRMLGHGFDMETLHESIDPTYAKIKAEAEKCGAHAIVKAADLIESYAFLLENGVGRHAKQIASGIWSKMDCHIKSLPKEVSEASSSVLISVVNGELYE